ncbi:MAG: recombination regulator RecX [Actinobacteria bacterium]|nr:recombination regulator RecX [Actinomycetota bacterium]
MSTTDGERIAPVTYLFGSRPDAVESVDGHGSPSVVPAQAAATEAATEAAPRTPVFVDLGEPEAADPRVSEVRAQLERTALRSEALSSEALRSEAADHIERDRAAATEPPRKGSFAPINNVSMHALARRGMSSHEMHDYLLSREFDRGAVDDEVERLESVALLDDVALGETLVRTLRDRKGLGRGALTAELRRRKLDSTAIELALDGLDDDELERATEVAHKRASQLRSYDAETAKRRLSAFLMRKGYSGSVVSTAVQRALAPSGPVFR